MRTFAQKQNQSQKAVSSSLARSNTATPGGSAHCKHPILHLQRTVGNQAVKRMLQTHDEELKAGLTATASPHFGHDFSRIPIHPPPAGALQTKLALNQPADEYEHEAEHVSQQVMRMPEPQLQRACPCGGECPECQTKQAGREHEHLQTERVQASDTAHIAAPPLVHEVLRAPGQPLDSATRGFMEPRFGHDFSRVRVHTDAKAAESARAVNALAYTVGHDMAFAAGQYVPQTSEGRRLVAHELAHVVQQSTASKQLRFADFALSSVGSDVLQRKPGKPTQAEARREQQLEELARDPGEAHQAWKKLSPMEQIAVLEKMRRRYGGPFAQQFLDEVKKGKPQIEVRTYQFGAGPKPAQLIASGYRRAGMEFTGNVGFEIEVWVHPSGRRIRRDVSPWKFGTAEPEKKPETEGKKPPIEKPPIEKPPPPACTEDDAMEYLTKLRLRNNDLQTLCASDPFDSDKVEDAQIEWDFAREKLRDDCKDVDMRAVYPDFWKEVDALTDENVALRAKCCKQDPTNFFFRCDELKPESKLAPNP